MIAMEVLAAVAVVAALVAGAAVTEGATVAVVVSKPCLPALSSPLAAGSVATVVTASAWELDAS